MSKILSHQILSVMVVDTYENLEAQTYETIGYSEEERINLTNWVESITLFQNRTARTNVAIRDRKGRFVSYRDCPLELNVAVGSLMPFPVPVV